MKTSIFKKGASMLLALVMCLSAFVGTTAFAADVTDEVYLISFPRDGDDNQSGTWGHGSLSYKNGWSSGSSSYTTIRAMGSYDGNICYCIEPGVPQNTGDAYTKKGENFWDNYPSGYNDVLSPDDIKLFIGRIMQYGYIGPISVNWRSQNEGGDKLAYAQATQLLIWETVVGERDEDFNKVGAGDKNAVLEQVSKNHPLYSKIMSHYNSIAKKVQQHTKLPSFLAKSTGKAQNIELQWNGSEYTAVLTDKNNVLGNYTFSSDSSGVRFSVNGDKLTVTTVAAPDKAVRITAEKKNAQRRGIITWTDGHYGPDGSLQDTVTYGESVSDPVKGYVNIKVSYGSAKIVKTSEDGKVDGISFHISGNGINQTVKTNTAGEFQLDNLTPGVYTVTEQSYDRYEPQEIRRVTVISGQTATVTFNNTLKRGELKVTKTSEDGLNEGVKFHLTGTSLSGLAVDEYAVTDKSGVAVFKDALIGSGYVLSEVDTAIRYVIPNHQTAAVEWNKVTNKSFTNILKKFNVTVTKSDAETGTAQGGASLAGAQYGIYKGEQLIDAYTTDADGRFTTQYYVCGDDWSIREISPSEGYLLNDTIYHIGAEAENYTVEYNTTANDVTEQVIKGNIAIIKHTDDGSTQIETPEVGAKFAVFLKASGSYENAKETERDVLTCDENGFAQSKDLPYGVYTVHQTKGWDGCELIKDFDVYIAKDSQAYRYLINNANFESYLKIVKVDAETGKAIAYAGASFQLYDPEGNLITQSFTYPTPTTIDTFYTNDEGYLFTPEKLPYGTGYSMIEVQAPYGYVVNSEPVYFDVTQDNSSDEGGLTVIEITKPNMAQKGIIRIGKIGEVFSTVTEADGVYQPVYAVQGLPGAVYEVTAAKDVITLDGTLRYSKGDVVTTITTDADGTAATEPLHLGKYEIREITAPYGMILNDEIHSVELAYAGQEIEITETATSFYNERQRVRIDLSKIMAQDEAFGIGRNGEILSVQFGLFAAETITATDGSVIPADGLLEILSCDENGKAVFTTDIPVGAKLYVKEIATDSHYLLSDTKYPVEFEYAGQDTATVSISVNNGEAIENQLIYGSVKGLKIDRETEETIAGALFGLFQADETEFTADTAILIAESGEDGVFTFDSVPFGSWVIRELKPAEGYLENDESYPVQVAENEEILEITAINDRVPEIGTTAAVDGQKEINATEIFTLTDTVSYRHLIPGKEYVLGGVLMDKITGKPLTIGGEEIRSKVTFTPNKPSGEVIVEFAFDAKFIKQDTRIVVFEALYRDGAELTAHADMEDEGQTVTVHVPEIGTQANISGKKEVTAKGNIIVDDVVSFKNLTPGKEYTVKGVLMNKATGKALFVNGQTVTSETTLTPEAADGEMTVSFTFDTGGITTATEIVVFESLYREGTEIAVHADISDEGQTVKIIPPAPDVPQTGDSSNMGFWIGLGSIALGGLIAAVMIHIRKKKDDDDE